MASDGNPVQIPVVSLVHGSQAPTKGTNSPVSGKSLPPSGKAAAAAAAAKSSAANRSSDVQAQVTFLNKYLNDSGRPDQFRVDPNTQTFIQEVNPASGEVIAEYSAISFPELAKSLGISSAVIDEHV
jgi:hypothetical protein